MSYVTPQRVCGPVWMQLSPPLPLHCSPLMPGTTFWLRPRPWAYTIPPRSGFSGLLPNTQALQSGLSGSRTCPGQAAPGFLPLRTQVKRRCCWLPASLHFIICSEKVELLVSTHLPGTARNSNQDVVLTPSAQHTLCSTEPDLPPKVI